MKRTFKQVLAAGAIALGGLSAMAVPARPVPFTVAQPNGEQLTLILHGDEHFHYYTTEDGLMVKETADGYYCYMAQENGVNAVTNVVAKNPQYRSAEDVQLLSGINQQSLVESAHSVAVQVNKIRRAQKRVMPEGDLTTFPTVGSPKALVILVEFPDQPFVLSDAKEQITEMLNERGYSKNGAKGSVADYFAEQSNGQFTPQFDVYGPYTATKEMAYYGANNEYGSDSNVTGLVREACKALDEEIDFSQYDQNGDRYVDNVYMIYAGYAESSGAGKDAIWPHEFWLSADYKQVKLDGVWVDQYGCSNEVTINDQLSGIGTICHEFSHVLGLPDLYNTAVSSSYTPCYWSILDVGCYLGNGWCPLGYSVYERYFCKWLEPNVLTDACNVTMKGTNDGGYTDVFKVDVPNKPTEYFLFENRQKNGFDSNAPGHGMLVWHINYDADLWDNNEVNNTQTNQGVDIVEASNRTGSYSTTGAGYPFPGNTYKYSFTDDTTPAFKAHDGSKLNSPITEIAEKSGVITFKFKGGGEEYNGVEETLADNGVQVNALQGAVSVACNSDAQVAIYNLQGAELVRTLQQAGEATYEVPAGIYVVKVGSVCAKVLVK